MSETDLIITPPRLGIIGFGEAGSSFARGLLSDGLTDIIAYDRPPGDIERTLASARAQELDITLSFTPDVLADREIIFSTVTQDAALDAARSVAPFLHPDALYADFNSLNPSTKNEVAGIVGRANRDFVDVAIMGAPIQGLHRVPLLASGLPASTLQQRLKPYGVNIDVIGTRPGQAAGVKIFRSILVKGLETLLVEALVAARRHDLDQQVLASFLDIFERKPARDLVDFLLRSHIVHAGRRSLEVAQSAQAVAEAGIDPVMSRTVSDRLAQLSSIGLKERLHASTPATIPEVLALLDEALGQTQNEVAA